MVELHTLGSPVLLDLLLQELFARGVRPARAGEFTLRAFLAGRIDLAQAEAVLGVIDADTPGELHSALRQLAGGVSREFDRLRSDLLDLLADLEAGLDFADEEIEFITPGQLAARLRAARESLRELAGQARDRQRESARWRVVLAGPPNAGKSTLFNALAGREAALVSPWAGTTRDWLAVEVELAGVPVLLVDTAGQETAVDEVSAQSQARQAEQVARADLVLWCEPATHPGDEPGDGMSDRAASAEPNQDRSASSSQLAPVGAGRSPAQTCPDGALRVATKCDLPGGSSGGVGVAEGAELAVSARRPETLVQLAEWVARRLESDPAGRGWLVGTTAARAADSVRGAAEALERALALAEHEPDQELLAVEVREALAELGKITGAVYTDDILDRIFSKFCIGK
jgi:tRNA modification GTPase